MAASETHAAVMADVPVDTRFDTRLFLFISIFFFGAFLAWGFLAELNAGSIASGEVIPAGRVKTVQHLEGGIIRAIKVKEGDRVAAGAELLLLDDTEGKAALSIAETDRATQEALVGRLIAERDGRIYQPPADIAASPSALAQIRLFESRREALNKELAGLKARLEDTRRELAGWESKDTSLRELVANAAEESKINQKLYEQNYISRPRLLQLESQRSDSASRVAENAAEISRARQRISETEVAISKLKNDWMNQLLEELRRAQDAATTARERAIVARDRLERTRIVAPQAGVVNGIKFTTVGGVIPPGGVVLDVIPEAEQLVIEARIPPDDIDVVNVGLDARVKLTAYKARSHITLKGKVTQVSGSTFRDEASQGQPFYKARIEIGGEEMHKVDRGALTPGMLAQVEIVAGRRSAIRYLLDPIIDSMGRAFKES